MRTWGRTYDELGNPTWREVTTDANGDNDAVYLTTMIQVLKLNLGESPFFSNYGIPAQQTIMTQIFPDYYAAQVQQQFAPFFLKCVITRVPNTVAPVYNVAVTTNSGAQIAAQIPV